MKKVLALVLALTMVLGFAATASAAGYGYGRFERDLFVAGYKVPYTINGEEDTEFDVEGNKEYTVKAKIDVDNIVNYPDVIDDIYDDLDQEYQVLELINQYANFDFYASADWTGEASSQPTSIYGDGNPLYTAVAALISSTDPVNGTPSSTIYKELVEAVQKNGNNFEKGYKSNAFQSAVADLDRAMRNSSYGVNSYYGYEDGIAVYATSKDSTYATVTSAPTVKFTREGNDTFCNVEFKVRFTNTTFRTADVDVEVKYLSGGSDTNIQYEHTDTLSFTVFQAQYRTFTEQDALIAFGVTPNVEISADDYAYISADAFRLMLQNSSRSITVVSGMGDSKVRFDKDSTNLPQDVFVGNFTTSANSDSVSINGFSSTTSAKIKIAVGRSFYNANNGKVISVYDANGNKLDVEATLQGDYTVNFYAPLSNYTVAGADWAGQTVPSTDAGKNNPSMGGAF